MPFSDLPRLLLGLFLLCGVVAQALANSSVATTGAAPHAEVGAFERPVWRDDSGQADWAAARAATYAPLGRRLAGGYTPAAHWLRVLVPASELPMKLRLRPAFVDQLDVYDELTGSQAALQARERPIASLGDRQLLSRAVGPSGLSGFVSLAAHDEPRHVFLMHGLFTSAIMLAFLMSRARRQDRLQREALAGSMKSSVRLKRPMCAGSSRGSS
jgi:hypothetical protein